MNGDPHMQTCVNYKGLYSTEAIGPDYDEINDDHDQCTHKEPLGKLLAPGEKSMEEGHDYHTLMPEGEQVSTSFECVHVHVAHNKLPQTQVQSVNQVVNDNYEVYQPSESGVSN